MHEQSIDAFLTWLAEERGGAENTIAAYRNDLSQFLAFLSGNSVAESWTDVSEGDIRAYRRALEAREYAPATVARKMASVRSFFHYRLLIGVQDTDPTLRVSTDVSERPSPEQLAHREARSLWDSVSGNTPLELRDRALVAMVTAAGLKTGQVVALDLGDVDLQATAGTVRLRDRRGAEQVVSLSPPVTADLARYIAEGRPKLAGHGAPATADAGPLFVNARGNRLSRQGMWLVIKKRGEEAGLGQEASPRALRGVLEKA